ncbi:anti-repressor SinI family protein [Paenibacillus xerothermodurans]|uniref:Sin domain-containing protein n=1 Tax=Paenibacillus xerothermodurans TaxID=1977292 RepID=A0A2W1N8X6_PAEXE|nr:anti-repressor SinI family protein [Paenibacillus xerothermodurans]PZE19591.1 hypothetical protein CBW46_017910 [Paenibacillus xerothermodurans]
MAFLRDTLTSDKHLDDNWVQLMIAARDIGLTKEEVRIFIQ